MGDRPHRPTLPSPMDPSPKFSGATINYKYKLMKLCHNDNVGQSKCSPVRPSGGSREEAVGVGAAAPFSAAPCRLS